MEFSKACPDAWTTTALSGLARQQPPQLDGAFLANKPSGQSPLAAQIHGRCQPSPMPHLTPVAAGSHGQTSPHQEPAAHWRPWRLNVRAVRFAASENLLAARLPARRLEPARQSHHGAGRARRHPALHRPCGCGAWVRSWQALQTISTFAIPAQPGSQCLWVLASAHASGHVRGPDVTSRCQSAPQPLWPLRHTTFLPM